MKLLTPKKLAEAIGASESSLRRWVDNGDIRMSRTAGGHRRIPLPEAIQFIRRIGAPVLRPELLGITDLHRRKAADGDLGDDQKLFEILRAGRRHVARGVILSWYLEGQQLSSLFDGPLRAALHRLGELWLEDEQGILIEHYATEICIEAISTLRGLLPAADERSPVAIGAAPAGDPYLLPTMMAGAVLAEVGFREVNFGANTPITLLAGEAVRRKARLVWLSLSAPLHAKPLRSEIKALARTLYQHHIALVLGGRHYSEYADASLQHVHLIESMTGLASFANGLRATKEGGSAPSTDVDPYAKQRRRRVAETRSI